VAVDPGDPRARPGDFAVEGSSRRRRRGEERRWTCCRGARKAILAVAASVLTAAYDVLRAGVAYRDLGPASLDRRDRTKTINRLLRRLHALGDELAPALAA
jgi:hypothetical protein